MFTFYCFYMFLKLKSFLKSKKKKKKKWKKLLEVKCRSSHQEVFLGKGALKIWSKFTREHPFQKVISIKLQSSLIEITLRHGWSLVNLLHIFRTFSPRNTYGWLLLKIFLVFRQVCLSKGFSLISFKVFYTL